MRKQKMKQKLIIIILFLTFFLMVGCDKIPEDIIDQIPDEVIDQIEDLLPSIELVGDELIIIQQYTTFTDPGVIVPGDFGLDITLESDVNTSVVGDYTVTYSVEYEGVTYSGTRTVRVVESTDTPAEPNLISFTCDANYTDIDCTLDVTTAGLTDATFRVEVWKDGSYNSLFWATDSNTIIEIDDLDQGAEYGIKLYTDYYVTGSEDQTAYVLLDEQTLTTKALTTYTTPALENLVITTEIGYESSVTFEFDFTDPDNTIDGYTSFGMQKVDSSPSDFEAIVVGHNIVTFTGYPVDPNTLYTLSVTTNYQIDEETFAWSTKVFEEFFLTPPDLDVVSFTSNQSVYFHGDRFIMILELDNDDDLNVEYVTVNGEKIYNDDFLFPSTNSHIYLNLNVETDYTNYSYHITDFAVTQSDESSYVINYEERLSFRLKEPGSIDPVEAEVNVLEITTDDFTIHMQDGVTDYAQVIIRLENEYNLDIFSIKLNNELYLASQFDEGSTLKQIVINIEINRYYNSVYIYDLIFVRNDENINSLHDSVASISIYGYETEDVISIGTPEELNSIDTTDNDLKIYMLSADIDMQTIMNFSPIGTKDDPFHGVFDGNGHTIYNLNYNSYSSDQSSYDYIGLFGYSGAFLYDITLTNMDFYVSSNADHQLYIGTLAGYSGGKVIDCNTWGPNEIDVDAMTKGYVGGLIGYSKAYIRDSIANTTINIDGLNNSDTEWPNMNVAGLIGFQEMYNIDTSSSTGTITIVNTNNVLYYVGGLAAQFGSSNSTRSDISNSFSSVDISTTNYGQGYVGGLVGDAGGFVGIMNSYASGDVYSERGHIGGLLGGSSVYIYNCFAVGNISLDSAYFDKLTEYRNAYYLLNNYVYDAAILTSEGKILTAVGDTFGIVMTASADEYNDEDFYTRLLGWSTYFYNFSDLDIVNGVLPTRK